MAAADGDTGVAAAALFTTKFAELFTEDGGIVMIGKGEMLSLSCLNSMRKRRLTKLNLDWAMVPITSACRSVTYWLSEKSCGLDSWGFSLLRKRLKHKSII
jgi:hypothetical protein